jgi:single-stranded-DNA-specific exonuclease
MLFAADAACAEHAASAALVVAGEGWHPGVVGIVASRLVERWHRPCVVVALDGDAGRGSGRSIAAYDLHAGLMSAADHLGRFGGHRMAAGCGIRPDRVDAFREAFNAHAHAVLDPERLVPEVRIDLEVELHHADENLARMLRHAGPFGMGNATPVFAARRVGLVGAAVTDRSGQVRAFGRSLAVFPLPARGVRLASGPWDREGAPTSVRSPRGRG